MTMNSDHTQWVEKVSEWRDATSTIPALVHDEIVKSKLDPGKAKHGPRSLMFDPLSIQFAMGYKDRRYSLTYETLKRIPAQLALIAAIIQTRCNQVASFAVPFRMSKSLGFAIKHKNPARLTTKGEREFIQSMESFIYSCGAKDPNPHSSVARDDFETFLKKLVRDSLMFDQACFEIVPDRKGSPYEFMAVDASTIRLAANNLNMDFSTAHRMNNHLYTGVPPAVIHPNATWPNQAAPYKTLAVRNPEIHDIPSFVQIVNGQIRNTYTRSELAWGVRNPRSDIYIQGYGYGELEQLVTIITSHLYAEEYNRRFFMQGCVSGDTLVPTSTGIRPIEELVGSVFSCWNGTEFVEADVVESGHKEAVRVSLANNFSLVTSPTHKFLSLDPATGETQMREISDLKVGDFVAQSDQLVAFEPLPPVAVQVGKQPKCPTESAGFLDSEFYEFVGYLVGDGYVSNTSANRKVGNKRLYTVSCVFGPKDTEVRARFCAMLSSRGIAFHMKKSGGGWGGMPLDTLVIRNKGLYDFLTDVVGMSTARSHEKTVPIRLFAESVPNRAAFLRGLFSADGCVRHNMHPVLASSSSRLIAGVQQLLWSLGMSSSLSHTLMNTSGRLCYYLRVAEPNKFVNTIGGFLQSYKAVVPTRADSKGALCPAAQKAIYKKLTGKNLVGVRSRTQLQQLASSTGKEVEALQYRWTQIKSIDRTGVLVPMYDVRQTHAGHRWSAGGCITSNSAPKGILNFKGDNLTPDQLESFRRQWRANVEGVENSWRTPIMQAEQGVDWINLHPSNQEMEYSQWIEYLIKITCAVFLIDPAELNFDMHGGVQQTPLFESSQEWKLKASRDRGLKPMLRFIAKLINENIVSKLDDHFMFDFLGLDELTEQEKHELRKEQVSTYMTLNEIRRAEDLPDVPDGDVILNPTYTTAQQQRRQMEMQEKQMASAAGTAAAAAGAQGGGGAQGAEGAQGAQGEEDKKSEAAQQYADSFTKSLKVLEINLEDESDAWMDLYRDG